MLTTFTLGQLSKFKSDNDKPIKDVDMVRNYFSATITMKVIILISLFCVTIVAANFHNDEFMESRIIGGKKAVKGQFPYQVSLREIISRRHFCGASIITDRFILTAAHCTTSMHSLPSLIVAVVGAIHRHIDGVTMKIDAIVRHKGFNKRTIEHDISLIRTARKIIFTETVQPISLPKQNLDGNLAVFSGWGQIKVCNEYS